MICSSSHILYLLINEYFMRISWLLLLLTRMEFPNRLQTSIMIVHQPVLGLHRHLVLGLLHLLEGALREVAVLLTLGRLPGHLF